MRPFRYLSSLLVLCTLPLFASELKESGDPASFQMEFAGKAKLRVVNLWATWCLPCVKELPDLAAIDREFAETDVQLLGVTLDDAIPGNRAEMKQQVRDFLKKRGVTYTNIYYIGSIPKVQDQFRFSGEIPLTVVYDSKGRELARHQGPVTKAAFSKELRQLLKKHGGK